MNCLEFRKLYEENPDIDAGADAHLSACEDCSRFVAEESKLDLMIGSLPKKASPGNFGAVVRTRIEKKRGGSNGFWAIARIAVPAAAMVLIVGFVVLNSDLFVSPVPTLPETRAKLEPADDTAPSENEPDKLQGPEEDSEPDTDAGSRGSEQPVRSDKELAENKKQNDDAPLAEDTATEKGRIRSIDSTDRAFEEETGTNPPGLDSNTLKIEKRTVEKTFSYPEILSTLGMKVSWRGGRLFVNSVTRNSVAQRSGVRPGDQVISIDGRRVSRTSAASGQVKGLNLKILRGGKEISLKIGRKPGE